MTVATSSRQKELDELRAGKAPLPDRVIQLRSLGMHAIRFDFVMRLLRSGINVDTLSIYWERGHEFMTAQTVEPRSRKLVLGRRKRVFGEFPDLWLLCYPDDGEIKQAIDRELDRMVEVVRQQGGY